MSYWLIFYSKPSGTGRKEAQVLVLPVPNCQSDFVSYSMADALSHLFHSEILLSSVFGYGESFQAHPGSSMGLAVPGLHLFGGQRGSLSSTVCSGSNLIAVFAKGLFKFIGSNETWQTEYCSNKQATAWL